MVFGADGIAGVAFEPLELPELLEELAFAAELVAFGVDSLPDHPQAAKAQSVSARAARLRVMIAIAEDTERCVQREKPL